MFENAHARQLQMINQNITNYSNDTYVGMIYAGTPPQCLNCGNDNYFFDTTTGITIVPPYYYNPN